MSRLTKIDYKSSNIDQILCRVKTNKSFSEILDDHNRILIENALHKLAEYENLGSVKEIESMGRLIDKLNKDYFKQQEIIRLAMQDLNTAIRDLKLCRTEERLKVIAELEEWVKENHKDYICRTQTNHLQGKTFSPHMVGASISVYLNTFIVDIKQKLNEMKGE